MDEHEPRPVFFARRANFSQLAEHHAPDAIYQRLWHEIEEPDILRSAIITLHLYIEYWLTKIMTCHGITEQNARTFYLKAKRLYEAGALSQENYDNILKINKIRNIYAHELELEQAEPQVRSLLSNTWLDPYFWTNDPDKFRAVSIQTMFLLESTWNNGGTPPSMDYPAAEMRGKLIQEGKIHWGECLSLSAEDISQYETRWTLSCPLCGEGEITRYKDNTPGFRESDMGRCSNCGLTGNGTELLLETANPKFRKTSET
ncbi:hypothetical protein [Haliangium ochraceum]|uniref:Uncharacterized protein n=1 Tax=Haliangium ochraceum (strain DSM 14365 / JCM 11303 / SMP-2) TaxID=502025 RepID=D0LMV8_HALO1|nr:hypothetical protein [Haliangium ochraceum]ACY13329.1 hypothetical protein Hoch_0701 [Haliangium ochraceum DSM 14365]